jgi:nitrate/nitrite transport system permease protein
MSLASNAQPKDSEVAPPAVPATAAKVASAPQPSKPRFPRVNAAIDTTIRVLSLIGFGFLKPIVAITRGEDPRAHMRQLWLDLGAPIVAIAAFLLVWSQVSQGIQTSLGQIPGPTAVWEQSKALRAYHLQQSEKATPFYERQ